MATAVATVKATRSTADHRVRNMKVPLCRRAAHRGVSQHLGQPTLRPRASAGFEAKLEDEILLVTRDVSFRGQRSPRRRSRNIRTNTTTTTTTPTTSTMSSATTTTCTIAATTSTKARQNREACPPHLGKFPVCLPVEALVALRLLGLGFSGLGVWGLGV